MSTQDLHLSNVFKSLEDASALEDLQHVIVETRDRFKVSHAVYHWVSSSGSQYGCGTYDPEWVERYIKQEYLRLDPVISGCYQRFHPVDWRHLDWSQKQVRGFQREAQQYGVGHQGYSIPIHGPHGQFALFSISDHREDADWDTFTQMHRRELILLAHAFNEKALEFEPGKAEETQAHLSPREVDTMTLLAMGYNRAQVADTLSISEHTLRAYIESARLKLGAQNTLQAVARAMSRGMIVV
ncbi:MAG: LuxR family transcriptional regulator [Paracoccaceae bacterium]|nr:LuxR family transcriptional regulator [Paracoccaceae bacterium]MDG2257519.1 LuxR family transcriptional regulator [Paracoccaceae bacterium]